MTKILPSPTLPVLRGTGNCLDDLIDQIITHGDFNARLGYEIDHVLCATIQLCVASLAAEAFHLGDSHARDAELR